MSEPKRMTFTSREVGGGQTSKTEWVLLEDYELLKAEVERLASTSTNADKFLISGLEQEVAILKAQVEAYKSASDEVAAAFLALPSPHNQVARVVEGIESLKAEVERLTDENARLTMMKDACKRMIKRRDKWIWEQKSEVERLKGCQMIDATYVVSPEDAERIRCRLEREKGEQP